MVVEAVVVQVENGGFIELFDCGIVVVFYIISKDFQLWFVVYFGFIGQYQVVILLEGVGFLCIFVYYYFVIEYIVGVVGYDVFVKFIVLIVWYGVINEGMVVNVLLFFVKVNVVVVSGQVRFFVYGVQVVVYDVAIQVYGIV